MPFIHIKSLPFEEPIDVSSVIKNLAFEFSSKTDIELCHIHTTWEFYPSGHYAKDDKVSENQPNQNFPIIVDLLTPDFHNTSQIALMLETIAESISTNIEFPKNNIFINHRQAHSGRVFDDGEIVRWE